MDRHFFAVEPHMRIGVVCLALTTAFSGCARPEQRQPSRSITLASGANITEIEVTKTAQGAGLFYRTPTPLNNCQATNAEVRELWQRLGQQEANKTGLRQFTLSPEDPSNRVRGFTYERRNDEWVEVNIFACDK